MMVTADGVMVLMTMMRSIARMISTVTVAMMLTKLLLNCARDVTGETEESDRK